MLSKGDFLIQKGFLASFPCSVARSSPVRELSPVTQGIISQLRRRNDQALGWKPQEPDGGRVLSIKHHPKNPSSPSVEVNFRDRGMKIPTGSANVTE